MSEPRDVEARLAWMRDNEPGQAGQCARWTWYALGGNQDPPNPPAWGTPDANAVVANMRAAGELHTDRNAPRGAIVLWTSNNHGHMALSKGPEYNNDIHSTDPYGNWGKTGTMPQKWPEQNWGQTWAGWSDYYAGVRLPMGAEPEPEPPEPEAVTAGFGLWQWYSGKKDSKVTLYPGSWLKVDLPAQPASGISAESTEFHFLYLRIELPGSRTATRTIETKFVRSDGDATAYWSPAWDAGSRDSIAYYNSHMEAGSGLGGQWWVKVSGGSDPISYTTRYAKTHVHHLDPATAALAAYDATATAGRRLLARLIGGPK